MRAISRKRDPLARLARPSGLLGLVELLAGVLADLLLDLADDLLGLSLASMDEEPARALWDVAADEQDADAEGGADPEGEAPAEVSGEEGCVEKGDRRPGRRPLRPSQ